jgi:putative inorganic carbon (hco3(-)) transporter
MAAAQRISPLGWRWLGGVGAGCLAIGLLAGVNPEYGVFGALGLMFALLTIQDLTLGLVLFTIASFLDLASSSGSFTGTKVIGLVLFVSWLARMAIRRGQDLAQLVSENPRLTVSLVGLLSWAVLSSTWAASSSTALGGAGRYALDMTLIPIAFSAVRKREHVIWILTAFVVGSVFSGAYGFIHPTSATAYDAGRLTGTIGDANGEATVLAAAIPLVISLVGVVRNSARLKLIALIGVAILFASLVDTLSREGLVSLAAVLVGGVIFGGRWRRRAAVLLVIGVTATVGYYFVLAPATSLQRVTMSDTSGRSSLWTVALRVIKANPILGVGNDNFILVENHYINQPGSIQAFYIVTSPKVSHNTFLETAADLGIPGLLLLIAVLGYALAAAVRAAWLFERLGDVQMELMSRAVVLSVVAVLTSDFFVASPYAKYLWLPLAMGPPLQHLARRATYAAGEPVDGDSSSDGGSEDEQAYIGRYGAEPLPAS